MIWPEEVGSWLQDFAMHPVSYKSKNEMLQGSMHVMQYFHKNTTFVSIITIFYFCLGILFVFEGPFLFFYANVNLHIQEENCNVNRSTH